MISFTLPLPPSVNKCYATDFRSKRRFKTKAYTAWENEALKALEEGKTIYRITGDEWLKVTYTFYTPLFYKNGNKQKVDVANFEKALSDFLSHTIEGFKDENILIMFLEKKAGFDTVAITIEEI